MQLFATNQGISDAQKAEDRAKIQKQGYYAESRQQMVGAKDALANAGLDVDNIYNSIDALTKLDEALNHLAYQEIDWTSMDSFESALYDVESAYGDLDSATVDYLYTLQENYASLSEYDKLLLIKPMEWVSLPHRKKSTFRHRKNTQIKQQ
jgi:hypothetical protein